MGCLPHARSLLPLLCLLWDFCLWYVCEWDSLLCRFGCTIEWVFWWFLCLQSWKLGAWKGGGVAFRFVFLGFQFLSSLELSKFGLFYMWIWKHLVIQIVVSFAIGIALEYCGDIKGLWWKFDKVHHFFGVLGWELESSRLPESAFLLVGVDIS